MISAELSSLLNRKVRELMSHMGYESKTFIICVCAMKFELILLSVYLMTQMVIMARNVSVLPSEHLTRFCIPVNHPTGWHATPCALPAPYLAKMTEHREP
jgi:hypothetical protein